ncbi:hypothetical protein KC349_g202 [Hortaea werneckii]|nr:hypothetical protein KC349_g202 [Hortaea werneckii]
MSCHTSTQDSCPKKDYNKNKNFKVVIRHVERNCISSECVPLSTTLPAWTTKILSAFWIVLSRCATEIVVRPSEALSRASWTRCSDSESSAEVASSRSRTFGLRRRRGVVAFGERRDEAFDVGVSASSCYTLLRDFFVERETHEQVLADCAGEQDRLLSYDGELRAQSLGVHILEVGPVHRDGSRSRVVESGG